MDFTEDPFKDYRYEDPFNIEDPFADVVDASDARLKQDPFNRPTSVAGFETDDFFSSTFNGDFKPTDKSGGRSGRVSAPPVPYDPFSKLKTVSSATNNDSWAAFPEDNWAANDAWTKTDAKFNKTTKSEDWANKDSNKTDNWASKSNWTADWSVDHNKNMNETWPTNTLPAKTEKQPKSSQFARSFVHTIGGIGRSNKKEKKKNNVAEVPSAKNALSEQEQYEWAAAESRRLQIEAEARRRQEDAELQMALAISRQEK